MFSRPTTFILGAGASYELGFPLGDQLKGQIADLLNILFQHGSYPVSGDDQIVDVLRMRAADQGSRNWNHLLSKAWQIRDALPGALSIDNVLDAHSSDQDLVYCGKLAICKAILSAERTSKLFGERRIHEATIFQKVAGTYLIPFFQMLTEGVRKESIAEAFENLSVITFNYDRSLERFLPEALATYYGIDDRAAAELAGSLNIIHPYGSVGTLCGSKGPIISFGSERADIASASERIRIFSEGIDDEDLNSRIYQAYFCAETLVFLGFAFHPINLQLLCAPGSAQTKRAIGTAFGLAEPARSAAEDMVMHSLGKSEVGVHWEGQSVSYLDRMELSNDTAAELLQAHFRGIV